MKRSAERRIGFGRWLLGVVIVAALLVATFSLVPAGMLHGHWPFGITINEVEAYAALLDLKPQDELTVKVERYYIGGSRKDGDCLLEQTGAGWSKRWFEADGYGDTTRVRRLATGAEGFVVKFDRDAPFNAQREITLTPAGPQSIRAKYLEVLAAELGLPTPEVSFVRVVACGKDLGLYVKEERIGRGFMDKQLMTDAALFTQGFDPDRPEDLLPRFADDTLAARTVRSTLVRLANEFGPGGSDALPFLVDEPAAIGWLLMRWMEGGDPFAEEGLFAYRWSTGRIQPLYARRYAIDDRLDSVAPVNLNILSMLLMRPEFQNGLTARRELLLTGLAAVRERFAAADAAWLPILSEGASIGVAQARATDIAEVLLGRLQQDPVRGMKRLIVPGVGYAALLTDDVPRYWPGTDDGTVLQRIGRMKAARVVGDTIVFGRGRFAIEEDLILPFGYTVLIEQGARFEIAPQRSVLCLGPLLVRGTRRNPVFVRAQQEGAPFGTFAVSCNGTEHCSINGLLISGGSGAIVNGIQYEGMVSIHGAHSTDLKDCVIGGSAGENALTIVDGSVVLANCVFEEGKNGLVHLDRVTGGVHDCVFKAGDAMSSDALRLSGSRVEVTGCRFEGFKGNGLSGGEGSQVLVRNSRFEGNGAAIAAKDASVVYVLDNTFATNALVFGVYRKKASYGGAHLMLGNNLYEANTKDRDVDTFSEVVPQTTLSAETLKIFEAR